MIQIFTTGGTIDKVYFDSKSAYAVGDPQIGEVLKQAHVTAEYTVQSLFRKDSLEITTDDRDLIKDAIAGHSASRFIITHGTDTMAETAQYLSGIHGKTIVLTGSLAPARFKDNDALFNVGFAFGAVQVLPAGVFIAMNGELYEPGKVRKDRELNRFVRT
jgi:L-asparaginase